MKNVIKKPLYSIWQLSKLRLIVGGFIIQLVLGHFYLWSPLGPYVTSYFRQITPDLSNKLTNIVQPSLGFAKTLSMPFGVMISSKLGYCWTTIILGFVLALALFHSSICSNFWYFYFDYSIIGGIINGCLVMLPIYQIQKSFSKQYKGVVTGIVFSGYGLGSMVWSSISFALINPNNLKAELDFEIKEKFFSQEVMDNVPFGLRVLGVIFFVCLTVSSMITFFKIENKIENTSQSPKKSSQQPQKHFFQNSPSFETDFVKERKKESSYYQLLFSKSYITIFSVAFLSSLFPMMLFNNYKLFSLDLHNDDKFITVTVASATSTANGLARITWGFIYDKFGFYQSFLVNQMIKLSLILLYFAFSPSQLGFTILVSLSFFCQGGIFILFLLYTLESFGYTNGTKIYGFVHYAFSIANLTQYFILYNLRQIFGYGAIFTLFFVGDVIACLLVFNKNQKIV